jgi:hypothetical protein
VGLDRTGAETPPRGVDEEVEEHRLTLGRAGEQEAAATQAGEGRLGHRRGEARRHHGVERVAALAQDRGGGGADLGVPARDESSGHVPRRRPGPP